MKGKSRNPRFYRCEDAPPLRLTARDSEILRLVAKHRMLRSTHVLSAIPGSRQNVLRRLQRLYHHQYLDRPRAQIEYYARGSDPITYCLGKKGLELATRQASAPGAFPSAMAGSVKPQFMRHTLLVAEIMLKIEKDCAADGSAEFIDEDKLRGKIVGSQAFVDPFAWNVTAAVQGANKSIGVRPDRAFSLSAPNGIPVLLFLEADRGTMPVTRSDFEQNSLYKKMLGYYETWRQEERRRRFGFQRFLVLFVLENPGRASNALRANMKFNGGRGSGLFAFASARALAGADSALRAPVITGRERHSTLLELIADRPSTPRPDTASLPGMV